MGTPNLVGNDTSDVFSTTKIKRARLLGTLDGGHLGFDLDLLVLRGQIQFPPTSEINPYVCTNYVRSFMLISKSARFSSYPDMIYTYVFILKLVLSFCVE